MKTGRQDIETILCDAVEIESEAEREAFLDKACGDDRELRRRVEKLIGDHFMAGDFLEDSPLTFAPTIDEPIAERPGQIIDRYKLLQEIGEGGFGVVYVAEQQEPVKRKVALKIIKLGMDTRQVIARFEAERQALAMMDHPNIAKVLDAGATDKGRPYFIMELVRGIPITDYCDENNLTTNERLELFADVCRAVQHAHQKGIIHRDIKPTNVMVTLHDGRPVPKVIDFGIAKATQHRLTEKTLYTDQHQFIGTPQYMSPEQAEMSGMDVDTRTDIYSLGVLLYELLVGCTPFDTNELRRAGYDEICRIIRENEPPTPSKRLSTLGQATTEVSKHRQAQPKDLRRLLRGDLDWIVMKALEKDRTRRYETPNDFAADVQRYLRSEPVEACHPSTVYKFRKFARRNRTLLTTVALVTSALLMGTVVSLWFAARESAARRQSEDLRYVSDMTRAEQARRDRDWRLVRRLLREHHPSADGIDRRGWEWRYLWLACQDTVPILRHDHIVYKFAISPDDRTLVSGDVEGNLKVWDISTRQELCSTKAHRGQVIDVEFSPDGSLLASSGFDNYVRLWRIDSGSRMLIEEGSLEGDKPVGNWQVVAFSHDGKSVATGEEGDKIHFWDLSSQERVDEIPKVPGNVARALAYHPHGEALATHAGDGVVVWPLPYNRDDPPQVFPDYDNIAWVALTFSPDGRMFAANWQRKGVDLYSVADQQRIHRLQPMMALSVAFSPESKTIAVGQWDKTVSIWDTTSGERLHELTGHSSAVSCVRFTSDGRTLASSSFDKTVRLWPLDEHVYVQEPRDVLSHHTRPVEAMSFSPDGRWLVTAERWSLQGEKKVLLWDTTTWHVVREFSGWDCALSRDSRILAIKSFRPVRREDGTIDVVAEARLWDLHDRQDLPPIPHAGPMAFSTDGNLAVVDGEKMRLWEPYERRLLAESFSSKMPPNTIMNLGFTADGMTLAARDYYGDIGLFDAKTLDLLQHRPEELELFGPSTAFSPNNPYWATPDYDHTVKVWDLRDKKLKLHRTLSGHTDSALCAAFSPDGGILAVGCANGSVRLWDTSTWKERVTLKCHDKAVWSICISPDGSTLVTGSDDTTVRIHQAASWEDVNEAERRGVDPLSAD